MAAGKPQPARFEGDPTPKPKPEVAVTDAEGLRAVLLADVRRDYERIAEVMAETREAIAVQESEHQQKLAVWQAACTKAREAYRVEPKRPESPDVEQLVALLHRMQEQVSAVAAHEQKVVGWSRLEIEGAWQRARQEFAAQVQHHVAELEAALSGIADWRKLLEDTRRADEAVKGFRDNGDSARMPSNVGIGDVIELAKGIDVLAPTPLPPRETKVERISKNEDAAEMRAIAEHVQQVERRNRMLGGRARL